MSEVSLLPAPRLNGDIEPRLIDLAQRWMLSPAREAGYELRLVEATVLPQRQVIARTEWGTWLFVDHVDDPTADAYGGDIPVPADQHSSSSSSTGPESCPICFGSVMKCRRLGERATPFRRLSPRRATCARRMSA